MIKANCFASSLLTCPGSAMAACHIRFSIVVNCPLLLLPAFFLLLDDSPSLLTDEEGILSSSSIAYFLVVRGWLCSAVCSESVTFSSTSTSLQPGTIISSSSCENGHVELFSHWPSQVMSLSSILPAMSSGAAHTSRRHCAPQSVGIDSGSSSPQ